MRTILVTGAAGFIGFHLSRVMLDEGWRVVGLDNHNDYYDPALKAAREAQLLDNPNYRPVRGSVEDPGLLTDLFAEERPEAVVHLAAQAGVRYSIQNPRAYVQANLLGTFELLEAARAHQEYVTRETLATSLVYNGAAGAPADIEGRRLLISVERQ